MLTINNKELRNLVEQVQKNKEDIANHYAIDRALSNLGIKIVGQVAVSGDLPDPTTYAGEFGDAYAVGNKAMVDAGQATYDYYIYTRPDANAGQPTNYWLNVGKISIVGPTGPQGPQGPQGDPGNDAMWLTGSFDPSGLGGSYPNGTLYLAINANPASLNGNVYKFDSNLGQWGLIGSLKGTQGAQGVQGPVGPAGPQGEQGPTGEKGDVGGFINIVGMLDNTSQLPDPATLDNLTYAYLVLHTGGTDQANDHYDLYIQVGMNSEEATWNNVGPFNAATLVTVNGAGQNVWDADTKLDKNTDTSTAPQLYFKTPNGLNRMINIVSSTTQNLSGGIPNINYLQENYMLSSEINQQFGQFNDSKLDKPALPNRGSVVTIGGTGTVATTPLVHESAAAWTVALRDNNGCIKTAAPVDSLDAANKAYVDSKAGGVSVILNSAFDPSTMTAIGAVVSYSSDAWPVYQFVPLWQQDDGAGNMYYGEADYSIIIASSDGSKITLINDYVYFNEYTSKFDIGMYLNVPIKGESMTYNKAVTHLFVK